MKKLLFLIPILSWLISVTTFASIDGYREFVTLDWKRMCTEMQIGEFNTSYLPCEDFPRNWETQIPGEWSTYAATNNDTDYRIVRYGEKEFCVALRNEVSMEKCNWINGTVWNISQNNSSVTENTGIIIPRKRNIPGHIIPSTDSTQVQGGSLEQSGSVITGDRIVSNTTPIALSWEDVAKGLWLWGILGSIGSIGGVLQLVLFLLTAWGLYLINKKSGEPYPWLAFIPIVQMYSFVKAGGKSGMWILWIILGTIAFIIPGLILSIMVIHGTSKRTGNGVGTTILALFFPFIMYPIMGNKMSDRSAKVESIAL